LTGDLSDPPPPSPFNHLTVHSWEVLFGWSGGRQQRNWFLLHSIMKRRNMEN